MPKFIGRFPIIDTLGVGGMGVVYSAKDPDIGRKVAIKVLHSVGDDSALERFKNEARTTGEISHPNIVILLEYGIDDKKPFLVMEYLAGLSLEVWIKKPRLLSEHKNILIDLCNALQFAHSKDILHRDLKPGNVQILPTGQAKLLDFGIARSQDTGLTASGFFIGTPNYLAPEILKSTVHSKKSDCYSLGLIAYTMLSGKNPFSAASFEATMTRQLTLIPTPLHELNPKIPIELSRTIEGYLQKDPENRPDTPEDLKIKLEQMSSPKVLKRLIVPSKNANKLQALETTIRMGEKRPIKNRTLIVAIVIVLLSVAVIYGYLNIQGDNILKKTDNLTVASQNKKLDDKRTQQKANEALESQVEDLTPASIDKTPVVGKILKVDKETISQKELTIANPKDQVNNEAKVSEKHTNVQNKPKTSKVVDKIAKNKNNKTTNKPTIKKQAISPEAKQQRKTKQEVIKQKPKEEILANKKEQTKPKTRAPAFKFPELKRKSSRIVISTSADTELSRGKTKKIKVKIPQDIEIKTFKIFRGTAEYPQIQVRKVKKLKNNDLLLTLYAEPNSTIGNYYLFGIYQNKKTRPILLKIRL